MVGTANPLKLKRDPSQPRQTFNNESLKELAASIKLHGIINPVEVTKEGVIVTGERRTRAAVLAGLKQIPIRIVDLTEAELRSRQLHENLNREDLSAYDTAVFLDAYRVSTRKTVGELQRELGWSEAKMTTTLSPLAFTTPVQELLKTPAIRPASIHFLRAVDNAERRGEIPVGITEKLAKKMQTELLKSENVRTISQAIRDNPGAANDYLKVDYTGMDFQQVNKIVNTIAPTAFEAIVSVNSEYIAISRAIGVLKRNLHKRAAKHFSKVRRLQLEEDLTELQKQVKEWLG